MKHFKDKRATTMNNPNIPAPVVQARTPLLWVPTGYFTMALTYNILTAACVIMFSNLGMNNTEAAGYASALGLAYTIKPLFAAFLEMYKTKKFFVLSSQVLQGIGFIAIALLLGLPSYFLPMITLFWIISFIGSVQDITSDGVYVTSMNSKQQAQFCGVQSFSWNLGKLAITGGLVILTGVLHQHIFGFAPNIVGEEWKKSWQVAFALLGGIMLAMAVWHWKFMPDGARSEHAPNNIAEAGSLLVDAFVTFFQKKGIWMMIGFAFLFRLSYGFLQAPSILFMKDTVEKGGLALSNQELGLIYSVFGLGANIIGSLIGGFYVAKKGLKVALFPLCCAINIPNVTFLALAIIKPDSYAIIASGVIIEQFFFGIGSVGFMIYLMQQLAPGKYATSHYAFGTALMGLCMMLTGMVSGYLQEHMGYIGYFIFVMVATIPSFLVCWFAPFHHKHEV